MTKKQVLSFLGMSSYCRALVPNCACLAEPLSAIAHGGGVTTQSKVTWIPETDVAFQDLKTALQSRPTLGLPDPTRPFVQTVVEKCSLMSSVLL